MVMAVLVTFRIKTQRCTKQDIFVQLNLCDAE